MIAMLQYLILLTKHKVHWFDALFSGIIVAYYLPSDIKFLFYNFQMYLENFSSFLYFCGSMICYGYCVCLYIFY